MFVHELISRLQDMPLNSTVQVVVSDGVFRDAMPEMVWNDDKEMYDMLI